MKLITRCCIIIRLPCDCNICSAHPGFSSVTVASSEAICVDISNNETRMSNDQRRLELDKIPVSINKGKGH